MEIFSIYSGFACHSDLLAYKANTSIGWAYVKQTRKNIGSKSPRKHQYGAAAPETTYMTISCGGCYETREGRGELPEMVDGVFQQTLRQRSNGRDKPVRGKLS